MSAEAAAGFDASVAALVARVRGGDVRAAASLMRDLEDGFHGELEGEGEGEAGGPRPEAAAALRALYALGGQACVVGVTGPPGCGKSTLVDALVAQRRAAGSRVGVVAVDPTSPFTGGAILGDRVRMGRHAVDPGVFIRSLATRGALGGLSRAAADVVAVLDAMGHDPVIIETVGVGQDEVDIAGVADVVVWVSMPGLGDEVQALKSGVLEIADVFVVNKSDREGAERAAHDLETMLELRAGGRAGRNVVKTVALDGRGVAELWTEIEGHRMRAQATTTWAARRRQQAEARVRALVVDRLRRETDAAMARDGRLAALVDDVAARHSDPYSAAEQVLRALRSR